MTDNEVVTRIAKKIRATRLEKKLTIQQLANRTRVSKGLLSKIENMRTVPSLPVFVTLIQSLDVSLKDFFKDLGAADGKEYQLVRKEHYLASPENGTSGVNHLHILLQSIPDSTLECVLLTVESERSGKISTDKGSAIIFLLTGLCQFEIGNEVVTVNQGDVVCFNSSTASSFRSVQTTLMLQLTFTPSK